MRTYFAYTRVSTQRQSDQGVSLSEQRRSITAYAATRKLIVHEWFEETETAAKRGRPVFRQMLDSLERQKNVGLLVHKVDRSARNLKDWADLGELIDRGVDVRFTHDDMDLASRGGRLSADIQAVIAADYIRNLREEILKGIQGRLRQGLYPLPAPFGYLNRGSGVAKVPEPVEAALVVYAFERFAEDNITQRDLLTELKLRGIPSGFGPSRLSALLRNRFYAGVVTVRDTSYPGVHQPLVSGELFDRVQRILARRCPGRRRVSTFRYRGRLHCSCGRMLSGERQKGHTYYRCHQCPGVSAREERFDAIVQDELELCGRRIRIDRNVPAELPPYAKFESCAVSEKPVVF